MPVVQVKLSDEDHKALKQHAAFLGIPMGEMLSRCAKHNFHQQAHVCKQMASTLESLDIEPEKGSDKICYGFFCFLCNKLVECRTGVYKGVGVPRKGIERLINERGKQGLKEWSRYHNEGKPVE